MPGRPTSCILGSRCDSFSAPETMTHPTARNSGISHLSGLALGALAQLRHPDVQIEHAHHFTKALDQDGNLIGFFTWVQ